MAVVVWSEEDKWGRELLAGARTLAKQLGDLPVVALNVGAKTKFRDSRSLIAAGADTVIEAPLALVDFKVEEYTDALAATLQGLSPTLLLLPATKNGRDLAARLAQRLKVGCVTDAVALRVIDGTLEMDRVVLGGNALATIRFARAPAVASVPSGTFEALVPDSSRTGEVRTLTVTGDGRKSTIVSVAPAAAGGVRLEDAKVVVSAGRGIKKKEDLKLCYDLAAAVGGEVGCTRPLSADLRWMSEAHWIGLSGKRVKPKLYFAVGVSGQIQHVAGMRDSGTIVTINKDPDCPMFSNTDYGLVGDLYEIVPALITAIKALKGH